MRLKIIKIGNSKGVRLPQAVLKEYKFGKEANLEMNEDGILLVPITKTRAGWEEQFKKSISPLSTEEQLWLAAQNEFEEEDWTW